jgi:hypothetical protein
LEAYGKLETEAYVLLRVCALSGGWATWKRSWQQVVLSVDDYQAKMEMRAFRKDSLIGDEQGISFTMKFS